MGKLRIDMVNGLVEKQKKGEAVEEAGEDLEGPDTSANAFDTETEDFKKKVLPKIYVPPEITTENIDPKEFLKKITLNNFGVAENPTDNDVLVAAENLSNEIKCTIHGRCIGRVYL